MKKIVTRASAPIEKRSSALLNPAPQTTIGTYRQPWDTRRGIAAGDREALLATITAAIARDLGDCTRFETIAVALGTDEPIDTSPYAYALNVSASGQMTAAGLWQSYALSMLYAGESYILELAGTLTPLIGGTVEVLIPARATMNPDGSPMLYAGFRVRNAAGVIVGEYGPDGLATGNGAIPGSRLLRTWLPHPDSPLRANPPLAAAQLPTEVLHSLRQATKSILVNDGMPAGVLQVTDPSVDDDSITALETRLNNRLSDPQRKGRTLVVDASVSYTSLGNTVLDGDWVQVAQSFREELLAVFRTPPSVLGQVGGMTYENQNVAARSYRSQVLLPMRQMLLDTLNVITRSQGYYLTTEVVDGSELDELQLAEQELKQAQRVQILATTGLATINELREIAGLPPVPGGDTIASPSVAVPQPSRQALPKAERAVEPARATPDLFDLEDDHFPAVADEVQRFMARIYRQVGGAVRRLSGATRAADDDSVADIKAEQVFDADARGQELSDDLLAVLAPVAEATVAATADALAVPATERWRDRLAARVALTVVGRGQYAGLTSELAIELQAALSTAYAGGESVDGAMGRVAQVLGVDPANTKTVGYRAERIARTTIVGTMNDMTYVQATESGVRLRKRWVATGDSRTRAEHAALDGVTIPLADKFLIGGSQADGPHAPGLPASQVVNCRCRLVFIPQE